MSGYRHGLFGLLLEKKIKLNAWQITGTNGYNGLLQEQPNALVSVPIVCQPVHPARSIAAAFQASFTFRCIYLPYLVPASEPFLWRLLLMGFLLGAALRLFQVVSVIFSAAARLLYLQELGCFEGGGGREIARPPLY